MNGYKWRASRMQDSSSAIICKQLLVHKEYHPLIKIPSNSSPASSSDFPFYFYMHYLASVFLPKLQVVIVKCHNDNQKYICFAYLFYHIHEHVTAPFRTLICFFTALDEKEQITKFGFQFLALVEVKVYIAILHLNMEYFQMNNPSQL